MDPCYVCQITNNDYYLSKSPCNCDIPIRVHLRCYVHIHDSICMVCGALMHPVIVTEKGRVVEFMDPTNSDKYVHYYINKHLHLDGTMTVYEEGGKIAKQTYKSDQLNGQSINYYKNGTISAIGYFKDGKRHGSMKYYSPDGHLENEKVYNNGIKVSEKIIK